MHVTDDQAVSIGVRKPQFWSPGVATEVEVRWRGQLATAICLARPPAPWAAASGERSSLKASGHTRKGEENPDA